MFMNSYYLFFLVKYHDGKKHIEIHLEDMVKFTIPTHIKINIQFSEAGLEDE